MHRPESGNKGNKGLIATKISKQQDTAATTNPRD